MDMTVSVGELVRLRKKHACGGDAFRVTFVGSDVKARCEKCGAFILLDRASFVRARVREQKVKK
jgi:hypothetical protein